jgi:hypothetical protein
MLAKAERALQSGSSPISNEKLAMGRCLAKAAD